MADAHGSGPCVRKDVGVQLPPRALWLRQTTKPLTGGDPARSGASVVLHAYGSPHSPPVGVAPNLTTASSCANDGTRAAGGRWGVGWWSVRTAGPSALPW